MRSVYDRACSYAWKCSPPLYKDIVHTAWLRNFNKDGSNLFDKNIYVVLRFIRNAWFTFIRDSKYQYKGELFYKQYFDASEMNLVSGSNPEKDLITKEFYEELFRRVDSYSSGWESSIDTRVLRKFLDQLNEGWTIPEITRETGMSPQRLHYYKLKLREIINQMEINNPFSGNFARPIKKITLKQYNEKYKDEYVCDFEREWCDENETSMLAVHKDREEYILVKLTKD